MDQLWCLRPNANASDHADKTSPQAAQWLTLTRTWVRMIGSRWTGPARVKPSGCAPTGSSRRTCASPRQGCVSRTLDRTDLRPGRIAQIVHDVLTTRG